MFDKLAQGASNKIGDRHIAVMSLGVADGDIAHQVYELSEALLVHIKISRID